MLKIRPMTIQDIPEAMLIEEENFSQPWSENAFYSSFQHKNTFFIAAFEDEILVGYCGLMCASDEGEIPNVSVKKEYQGRHVGRRLLEELLFLAKSQGVTNCYLEVRMSNIRALRLYQSMGFEIFGIRRSFYQNPTEDAYVMKRTI